VNVLRFSIRVKVIAHLVTGCSIRATAQLCGVDKDAVMKLGADVGRACLVLHARLVRGVPAALLECDEVWAYVGRHERRKLPKDPAEWGDNYTMFAIDPVSKLVPSFLTGPRDLATATAFACDLRSRIVGKPQISIDGWPSWPEAFRRAFGWSGCNLGVCIKEYENDNDARDPARKYSPGRVKSVTKRAALGCPDEGSISTALAERLNLTTRMSMRRLTRLTNAYSKKRENLVAAVGLHFMHYNFVRVHEAIGTTPAVAAGIADAPWSLDELVGAALEIAESTPGPKAPAPAPVSPEPSTPAPLPTWETWREPVQLGLPGVDAANDNAALAESAEDDEGPVTVREPMPWGDRAAE
jgi:IS1 family transposase